MKRLVVLLVVLLVAIPLFSQSLQGTYKILPTSKSIYTSMTIEKDQVFLINNNMIKIFSCSLSYQDNIALIFIGGLGYYYSLIKDYLVLTPAFEKANVIYARKVN